jgi:alpha-tubulin suppressor-like RCC1 family protein
MFGGMNSNIIRRKPETGNLWVWGRGYNYGFLGLGNRVNLSSPVALGRRNDWYSVSSSATHALALTVGGRLWAWGNSNNGEIGDNTNQPRSSPVQIGTLTDWTYAHAGRTTSFAMRSNGTLWAWGQNGSGQLGINRTTNTNSPIQVTSGGFTGFWKSVNVDEATAAVRGDGTLWTCGLNNYGQLGLGVFGTNMSVLMQVTGGSGGTGGWSKVSSGRTHILALKEDGTLWAAGNNSAGQLGLGNTVSRSVFFQITGGAGATNDWMLPVANKGFGRKSFAIKRNGTLWGWGYNNFFSLGLGDSSNRSVPVQIGTFTDWVAMMPSTNGGTFGLRRNGTLWIWGNNNYGMAGQSLSTYGWSPVQMGTGNDWSSLLQSGSNSYNFLFALKTNGTMWAWGRGQGNYRQLGLGNTTNFSAPQQITGGGGATNDWKMVGPRRQGGHALRNNGTLWGWGEAFDFQNGDGTSTTRSVPTLVTGGAGATNDWATFSTGRSFCMAIKTNGTLWGWGRNNYGNLGLGDTTTRSFATQVGTGNNWSAVKCGFAEVLATKTDGTLWGWGRNANGQLGLRDTVARSSPVQITGAGETGWTRGLTSLGVGGRHCLVIRENGTLWGLGGYDGRLLGNGVFGGRSVPMQITGATPGGGTNDWLQVNCTQNQTFALKTDGTLWCCGFNGYSVLGLGRAGELRGGDGFGLVGRFTLQGTTADKWKDVSGNGVSIAGIRQDGTLWGWGGRNYGVGCVPYMVLISSPMLVSSFNGWTTNIGATGVRNIGTGIGSAMVIRRRKTDPN